MENTNAPAPISAAEALESQQKVDAKRRADARQAQLDAHKKEDGWVNTLSGIGDPFNDKRQASFFLRDAVNWQSAEDLWRSDDMAARAVECLPDEMTREGFEIVIQNEDTDSTTGLQNPDPEAPSNTSQAEEFQQSAGTHAPPPKGTPRKDAPGTLNTSSIQNPEQPNAAEGGRGAQPDAPTPQESDGQAEDDDSKKIAELMMARCDDLDVLDKVRQCLYFARAYGGGALLIGADDGELDWSKPLNEKNIKSITYLNALEPRELLPLYYYGDPRAPKYGEPMIYQLNRIMIAGEVPQNQAYLRIHESRLIRFDGVRVGRRQIVANAGWGDSIFTRIIQTVQDFQNVWQGAALIMSDFGQAVLKIKGLAEMVAKNGKNAVQMRAQAISMARSITNMVLLDSEEEFERKPTPMTGFPEMLDRFCNRLASSLKTPVTILMGQAPAGLNATGQSDLEWFANQVKAEQGRHMKKQLTRLIRLLFLDKAGVTKGVEPSNWSITFPSLKQMSDVEKADVRLKTSQADASDVAAGILLPAEIAKSRYGGDKYSTETQVDLELREQTRKAVQEEPGQIDDEFHTGAGEPGSEPTPEPTPLEAAQIKSLETVQEAGANAKPDIGGSK